MVSAPPGVHGTAVEGLPARTHSQGSQIQPVSPPGPCHSLQSVAVSGIQIFHGVPRSTGRPQTRQQVPGGVALALGVGGDPARA